MTSRMEDDAVYAICPGENEGFCIFFVRIFVRCEFFRHQKSSEDTRIKTPALVTATSTAALAIHILKG